MKRRDYQAIAGAVRRRIGSPGDARNPSKTPENTAPNGFPAPEGAPDAALRIIADALWEGLSGHGVSWVGFYRIVPGAPDDRAMALGPSRDKPACSPIGLHGACGQAFRSGRTLIVRDVADLGEGYVACDPRDRSEIVLPCFSSVDGEPRCWGVLDLDSFEVGAFDGSDESGLTLVLSAAGIGVTPSGVASSG